MAKKKKPITYHTKKSILARLKIGPTPFAEWAFSKNSRHPARLQAREICDALVAEGIARHVYIGDFRYYILNTKDAEDQAVRQYIDENSRHDKASGCTVWTGYHDPLRGPIMRVPFTGRTVSIARRFIWEQSGRPLKKTDSVKMKSTCDCDCIDAEHMVKVTRSTINKRPKTASFRAKQSIAMRKRLGTKQEDIDLIRGSDAGVTELAKLTGYSRANVALIRAYKTNKHGTEFAGLIR